MSYSVRRQPSDVEVHVIGLLPLRTPLVNSGGWSSDSSVCSGSGSGSATPLLLFGLVRCFFLLSWRYNSATRARSFSRLGAGPAGGLPSRCFAHLGLVPWYVVEKTWPQVPHLCCLGRRLGLPRPSRALRTRDAGTSGVSSSYPWKRRV